MTAGAGLRSAPFLLLFSLALLFAAGPAQANGAFPDSGQLLLPPGRSNEMTLGTNFGLLTTEDGGKSWHWTCESQDSQLGRLYQQLPSGRIIGISNSGLVTTDDAGCSWQVSARPRAGGVAMDAFADTTNPDRILVTVTDPESGFAKTVHESLDGGQTFGEPLFVAGPDEVLTGVEVSRSDPNIILISLYSESAEDPEQVRPKLARSTNGGLDWSHLDLYSQVGKAQPAIIAVDEEDPDKIFLRLSNSAIGDRMAVSLDAGRSFTTPVHVEGYLSAFLRRDDGTVLVAGVVNQAGVAFQSSDGGVTFEAWPVALGLRALAERNGNLYAAADNFRDGVAVVRLADDGATWDPLLKYSDIVGIKDCVRVSCQSNCFYNSGVGVWPPAICGPTAVTPDPVGPGEAPVVPQPKPSAGESSGCRMAPLSPNPSLGASATLLLACGVVGCASRRRRGRRN